MRQLLPIEQRLAWLAGILDGEGYVSATITKTRAGRKRTTIGRPKAGMPLEWKDTYERSLRFQVRVGNTDAAMIREIASIADSIGIKYFIFSHCPKQRGAGKYKELFGIHFHGKDRTKRLLTAVLPWLVTKRPQAELLLEMIIRRTAMPYNKGSLEDGILQEQLGVLRGLNRRGRVPGEIVVPTPASSLYPTRSEPFPRDVVRAQQGAEQSLPY